MSELNVFIGEFSRRSHAFWILEGFLALGMLGREFGSKLPGVITSIRNPNNKYFCLRWKPTENSYIRIGVPLVIEST